MTDAIGITRLQDRMLEAFHHLTSKEAEELLRATASSAVEKGFTYMRHGGLVEAINLMLVPSFVTVAQAEYLTKISLAVKRGVEAVYNAWFTDQDVRALLPFDEAEEAWIRDLRRESAASEPLWYRLDGHFHMKEENWKDRISFFEINSCAVGGIHYSPMADSLFMESILPVLRAHLPRLPQLRKNPDLREMLRELVIRHSAALGRKGNTLAFVEDSTLTEGITEGPYIVERLKSSGLDAVLVDPRDLYMKEGEIYFRDTAIDVVYRNFELSDLMEIDAAGDDVSAVKQAFRENRAISSLLGDFDHKSMWEALTSGEFDRYFSLKDAALLKKHLLWTRVVKERRTIGPDGFEVDLLPFALKNKEALVLKPNRLCGGSGVVIGKTAGEGEWEALLNEALKEESGWVLQRYGKPERYTFPLFENGDIAFEEHNIVYGLSSTALESGLLGRVSREGVVNVAQQGGLMPVLRIA
ncbi:MAG: hypothetical protein IT362_05120 [Deltaproteobacteria bacterium]|nr:hypothetical protein [Deltaproteobacteria bacterium]